MKKSRLRTWISGALGFLLTSIGLSTMAQVAPLPPIICPVPVVTILATDPVATWSGSPGVFTVFRSGNLAPTLNVYYDIGGTATNGVDYQPISHWVQIPSGVLSSDIVINPIDLGQVDTRTVILTLTNSQPLSPLGAGPTIPINYLIGSPSSATVDITVGPVTNIPPVVSIVFPSDGASFYTPINLPIVACARDVDGSVVSVEFFADGVSLGTVSNSLNILPPTPTPLSGTPPMPPYRPFVLVWSNAPPGTNILLTAKATDDGGASTLSDPVSITVRPGPPPPPPTNFPPIVRIISPANGATFRAPVDLPIFAFTADVGGYVTGVEFFAGTNNLGPGHHAAAPLLPPGPIQSATMIEYPNYWVVLWSNVPPGSYPLTAVATDNLGLSTVSDPVNVTMLPPLPPPTPTNVVNIIALDPIAVEGTNCWPWLGLVGATPAWSNLTATTCVWRYLTNCAPKSALFAVHRFGETNGNLVVGYGIGGTASNGVDYIMLPGSVTIPTGHRLALITVTPLDDGPPDISSTVILTLKPSTNYIVGRPARAAAIILDGPSPTPASVMLPDGTFHLQSRGPDGAWFHIECTSDLLHWTSICTNQVVDGSIDFIDPDAPANQLRFYRAVLEAGPPQ